MNQDLGDISESLRQLYGVLGEGGSAQGRLEEFCLLTANYIHNQGDTAPLVALLKEYGELE